MPDSVSSWLATMREIVGTKWAPGDGQDPTIQSCGAASPGDENRPMATSQITGLI